MQFFFLFWIKKIFFVCLFLANQIRFQYYNSDNREIKAQSSIISVIHDNNHIPTIENLTRPISIKIYGLIKKSLNFSLKNLIYSIDLHATNLQRGIFFKPDPYIKVTLIAGRLHKQLRTSSHFYNQEKRTNVIPNTVDLFKTQNKTIKMFVLVFFLCSAIRNGTINRLYFKHFIQIYWNLKSKINLLKLDHQWIDFSAN